MSSSYAFLDFLVVPFMPRHYYSNEYVCAYVPMETQYHETENKVNRKLLLKLMDNENKRACKRETKRTK